MHIDEWLEILAKEEQEKQAAAGLERLFDHMDVEDVLKIAQGDGHMSQERREDLPSKSFAVPESKAKKIGVAGEIKGEAKGKYPIPDEKHARNALARVSQHGTPAEREAVRKKVYSKFPGLREGFEERHGESPTSKENVKKIEQGGIGKAAQAKMAVMDKLARQLAREHVEVARKFEKEALSKKLLLRASDAASRKAVRAYSRLPFHEAERIGVKALRQEKRFRSAAAKKLKRAGGMIKQDAFTTPEAQAKAKVMRTAMKATKGAPPKVMKSAIKMTARKIRQVE